MPPIVVTILAHNEERRIATCLASLPLDAADVAVHVVVNGSTDRTARIAREFAGVTVHEYAEGGKSRSWNRFVLDSAGLEAETYVFVDGDAEVQPGSLAALARTLADNPTANAAAGLPCNGRRAPYYREMIMRDHNMFGDLYALRGDFVARMRARGIRLPNDLVGDDGLLAAFAKTDLKNESHWNDAGVAPCPDAGFLCEPTRMNPASLSIQYRRMINYAVRHFQNRIISDIMRGEGPVGLPRQLSSLYPQYLPQFTPRAHPAWWWFDRLALKRMAEACAA
ncbi:glycosyltransferase family 2 protein [Tsuneonella suprasediminis]|uniref:glycosyltransferase family 2 protein n=1 Tax=Tsuneonella suprasediminis TaxID=2306996 RepID=UPI002F9241EF